MGNRRKHLLCFTDLNTDLAGWQMNRKRKKLEKQKSRQNERKSSFSKQFCMYMALGMSRVLTRNQWMLLKACWEFITENHPQDNANWRTSPSQNCLKRTQGSLLELQI